MDDDRRIKELECRVSLLMDKATYLEGEAIESKQRLDRVSSALDRRVDEVERVRNAAMMLAGVASLAVVTCVVLLAIALVRGGRC